MQAIRIQRTGGPHVLELADCPTPEPGADELLVRNRACGVNFIDIYHRTGLYPVDLPATLGLEGAGEVEAVGEAVTGFAPGDRVAYANAPGADAEYLTVPARFAVHVPDALSLETAAAAMLQGMTAHAFTHSTVQIEPGAWVLIHAAAGGAGQLLVQMAKRLGAQVIGTVSSEEKAAVARTRGADHIILYTQEDFVARTREITGGEGVHVVYDSVGQSTFLKDFDVLRRRGTLVLFGQSSGPVEPFNPALLVQRGSLYLTRPILFDYIAERAELEWRANDLLGWLADGSLEIAVDRSLPLRDAAEAHELLAGRHTTGKLLLIP